jgi:ureidoacrylate peracid hydrolase
MHSDYAFKYKGDKMLNPSTTAIVLIEFQNDFTSPGGVFHEAVKGVMQSNNMLPNTIATVNSARKAGITIMHVPITFAEGYGEITNRQQGVSQRLLGRRNR